MAKHRCVYLVGGPYDYPSYVCSTFERAKTTAAAMDTAYGWPDYFEVRTMRLDVDPTTITKDGAG